MFCKFESQGVVVVKQALIPASALSLSSVTTNNYGNGIRSIDDDDDSNYGCSGDEDDDDSNHGCSGDEDDDDSNYGCNGDEDDDEDDDDNVVECSTCNGDLHEFDYNRHLALFGYPSTNAADVPDSVVSSLCFCKRQVQIHNKDYGYGVVSSKSSPFYGMAYVSCALEYKDKERCTYWKLLCPTCFSICECIDESSPSMNTISHNDTLHTNNINLSTKKSCHLVKGGNMRMRHRHRRFVCHTCHHYMIQYKLTPCTLPKTITTTTTY